uniref:Uncharacterized protein n=1 Tax=Oryza punctata TaxID=4537 RepID=A0A0E0JQP3_ORYPU
MEALKMTPFPPKERGKMVMSETWCLALAHSIPNSPSQQQSPSPGSSNTQPPPAAAQRRGEEQITTTLTSNGVQLPLQQLQLQQGEEASAEEGAAQAADRQGPGQPRGARKEQGSKLQEMSLVVPGGKNREPQLQEMNT